MKHAKNLVGCNYRLIIYMKILHITPHLGGGIGKVLSELVKQSIKTNDVNHIEHHIEHQIMCLEQPEKLQFIEEINKYGKKVIICPSIQEQIYLINDADIVQLELFDSHGINKGKSQSIKYLHDSNSPLNNLPIRFIIWYHNNGLYDKFLPYELVEKSHKFLFTSQCSFENKRLITKFESKINESNLNTVFASGGFNNIPFTEVLYDSSARFCCFKQLNPAKLHPDIDSYLKCLHSNYKIKIFENFVPDIIEELKSTNVVIYLLNPKHFGCSENLLLECMAMGIIPIVFNNPAERYIVENGKTGFIVNDITEFKNVICFLYKNMSERYKIGLNAAKSVRERFSVKKTEDGLNHHYNELMQINKEKIDFSLIQFN